MSTPPSPTASLSRHMVCQKCPCAPHGSTHMVPTPNSKPSPLTFLKAQPAARAPPVVHVPLSVVAPLGEKYLELKWERFCSGQRVNPYSTPTARVPPHLVFPYAGRTRRVGEEGLDRRINDGMLGRLSAPERAAYQDKDRQVLRIAASDVAAVAGYHEWVDVRELFLERLLYQASEASSCVPRVWAARGRVSFAASGIWHRQFLSASVFFFFMCLSCFLYIYRFVCPTISV